MADDCRFATSLSLYAYSLERPMRGALFLCVRYARLIFWPFSRVKFFSALFVVLWYNNAEYAKIRGRRSSRFPRGNER